MQAIGQINQAIITQFQVMKQTKVKSFIKLIGKIHQITKQQTPNPLKNHEYYDKLRKMTKQKQQCSKTINFIEETDIIHDNKLQRSGKSIYNENHAAGIYFTEQAIKHRYDDKKSLYDIYRDSLHKKKNTQNAFVKNIHKHNQIRRAEDELEHAHQIAFPINRGNKLKDRRQSYTYQKIVRKKNVLSNRSISMFPQEAESKPKIKTIKTHQNDGSDDELMRDKRLNYKPIFRIKRLNLENCKTEATHNSIHEQVSKFDKCTFSRRSVNINTEPAQNDLQKQTFRQAVKSKKNKSKMLMMMNEKFTAWEHDKYEQNEELIRILL